MHGKRKEGERNTSLSKKGKDGQEVKEKEGKGENKIQSHLFKIAFLFLILI